MNNDNNHNDTEQCTVCFIERDSTEFWNCTQCVHKYCHKCFVEIMKSPRQRCPYCGISFLNPVDQPRIPIPIDQSRMFSVPSYSFNPLYYGRYTDTHPIMARIPPPPPPPRDPSSTLIQQLYQDRQPLDIIQAIVDLIEVLPSLQGGRAQQPNQRPDVTESNFRFNINPNNVNRSPSL